MLKKCGTNVSLLLLAGLALLYLLLFVVVVLVWLVCSATETLLHTPPFDVSSSRPSFPSPFPIPLLPSFPLSLLCSFPPLYCWRFLIFLYAEVVVMYVWLWYVDVCGRVCVLVCGEVGVWECVCVPLRYRAFSLLLGLWLLADRLSDKVLCRGNQIRCKCYACVMYRCW